MVNLIKIAETDIILDNKKEKLKKVKNITQDIIHLIVDNNGIR